MITSPSQNGMKIAIANRIAVAFRFPVNKNGSITSPDALIHLREAYSDFLIEGLAYVSNDSWYRNDYCGFRDHNF